MFVGDVMMRGVYTAQPTDALVHVAALMKRHNVGAIPICDGDRLLGIITDRDLAIECLAGKCDPMTAPVCEFMTADVVCVTPETTLERAAEMMGQEQVRRLCVCENGRMVGILSLGDLAVALADDRLIADTLRALCAPLRVPTTDVHLAQARVPIVAGMRASGAAGEARPEWEDLIGSDL